MDNKAKILLVDDEIDFLVVLASWLKSNGYSVNIVHNGKSALEIIKSDPPDLIFLDIFMPEMDGYAVLKTVREFNKTLPIIMMSAYVDKKRIEDKVASYNASGIFYKDDELSKVLDLVGAALKKTKA